MHYLDHCWLVISEVFWHVPQWNFTENTQDIYAWYEFENYYFKITCASPRGRIKSKEIGTILSMIAAWRK